MTEQIAFPKCSNINCKRPATDGFKRCPQCRENDRNRRSSLIARGLCVRCEVRPSVQDRTSCERCLAFDRARNARLREKHLAAGRCVRCEKPPRPGKKTCEDCGNEHKLLAAKGLCCRCKREPATVGRFCLECKKKHIAWEEAQVAAGKCIKCDTTAVRGLLHCERHRALDRAHTRRRTKRLKAEGKCRICTKPSFGKTRCPDCQKAHTDNARRRREELRAKGLCECCGKRPFALDWRRCEECQERKNNQQRNRSRTPEQITADRARAKKLREETLAKGLCYRCMRRPFAEGRKTCDECMEVQRVRFRIASSKKKRERKMAQANPKRTSRTIIPKEPHRVRIG